MREQGSMAMSGVEPRSITFLCAAGTCGARVYEAEKRPEAISVKEHTVQLALSPAFRVTQPIA